jgi:hypothetical protein
MPFLIFHVVLFLQIHPLTHFFSPTILGIVVKFITLDIMTQKGDRWHMSVWHIKQQHHLDFTQKLLVAVKDLAPLNIHRTVYRTLAVREFSWVPLGKCRVERRIWHERVRENTFKLNIHHSRYERHYIFWDNHSIANIKKGRVIQSTTQQDANRWYTLDQPNSMFRPIEGIIRFVPLSYKNGIYFIYNSVRNCVPSDPILCAHLCTCFINRWPEDGCMSSRNM